MDVLTPALPGREDGHQHRLLVHDRAAVLQRRALHRQHAQREPHSRRVRAGASTRKPARSSGTSTRFRRTKKIRAGTIAGPTWVGGERNGGGIWETAAIDPRAGTAVHAGRESVRRQHEARRASNLFTDSIIALTLDTGTLKWYFQQTHHDVWDYDSAAPPILFDMQVRGQRVKALAHASKNGYLYILNRETGQPVHPIKEMPVPTAGARPGEQPWPTQPIPFTASGQADGAGVPDRAAGNSARAARQRTRSFRSTRRCAPNQIFAPGSGGGSELQPDLLQPADRPALRRRDRQPVQLGRRGPKGYFSAYDPTTGELVWRQIFEGFGQAGSVVTAGGVVFVGAGSNIAGYFFAFDAKTGEQLWKFNTGAGVFSSPSIYMVNGEAVRHRRVGRRRARAARRRSDSELRAAETLSADDEISTQSSPNSQRLKTHCQQDLRRGVDPIQW